MNKTAKKTTITRKKLAKYNYNIDVDIISDENSFINLLTFRYLEDGEEEKDYFEFSFESKKDNFCCGLYSIGDFSIDKQIYKNNIPKEDCIFFIKEIFRELLKNIKSKRREVTVMFTTIDNEEGSLIDQALSDEKYFTLVKQFINRNSGNKNKLYISN